MALSGTLDDFNLVDIIQLVDLGQKTCTIELKGLQNAEASEGQISFYEGAVYGAEIGLLTGEAALYNLFLATNGEFELHEGSEPPPRTILTSNALVILEGSSRREAWNRLSGRLPHENQLLELVAAPSGAPEEITVELDKWRIITLIDGSRTVGEIVSRAGIGRQRALQMIVELLEAGLAERQQAAPGR
jgi:hypothetical protein